MARQKRNTTDRPPTEQSVLDLLSRRYTAPRYAFLPQVRSCTGFVRTPRTADALAMSLWPSQGLELLGFEVKVSRADWLRELRAPEKAEQISAYCDRWYVVTGADGIVERGELPPLWGLIVVTNKGLRTDVRAEKMETKPLDLPIICAMLRRVSEIAVPDAKLKASYEDGYAEGLKASDEELKSEHERLAEHVREFEEASGVRIHSYSAGRIGDAVKIVLNANHIQAIAQLRYLRRQAQEIIERVDQALEEIPKEAVHDA